VGSRIRANERHVSVRLACEAGERKETMERISSVGRFCMDVAWGFGVRVGQRIDDLLFSTF
jgi:hypothetical protein